MSGAGDRIPPLSLEEFRLLRGTIADYCGILLSETNRGRVERKLHPRLVELGASSFSEYHRLLKYSREGKVELARIAELISNNETYFFREEYQLKAFSDEILPDIHWRNQERRRLNVWSAGCSTGEEAYTLAILVRESGLFAGWEVRIFGCDISRKAIAKARRGVYGPSSFRFSDSDRERRIQNTYFEEMKRGFRIRPPLREMVTFHRANLLDDGALAPLGSLDVILCRNVFIYFPERARSQAVGIFYNKLKPGGYLLLGHSENLLNTSTSFEVARLSNDLVYRRPLRETSSLSASRLRATTAPSKRAQTARDYDRATGPAFDTPDRRRAGREVERDVADPGEEQR